MEDMVVIILQGAEEEEAAEIEEERGYKSQSPHCQISRHSFQLLSFLNNGIYLIRIEGKELNYEAKIVIMK